MTLPNDSHASGATTFATHLVSGKEYPVGMGADADGHIHGSLPAWGFIVPQTAAAASKIYFDLFNNEAGRILRLRKLFCIPAIDVAVAPVVGVRLDIMRTSAIGTGGTGFVGPTSASKTAAAFWPFARGATLPAGITGRAIPTGGATDQAWLWPTFVTGEESNVATGAGGVAAALLPMFNMLPEVPFGQAIELDTGSGLKVVQGAVASAGNFGFLGVFTIE